MLPRLLLMAGGGLAALAAMACAGGGQDPGIVAIAVNLDVGARPRLAFYAGLPGQDSFVLPAGNYELLSMDMSGGLLTESRAGVDREDVAADVLSAPRPPAPPEDIGRRNREAMRDLFLFFARFNDAQIHLEDVLTGGQTRPAPASPEELTAAEILGEERPQGRLPGIRDWESDMGSWGRILELGLQNTVAGLPAGSLDGSRSPFAEAQALVREWRDSGAVDRRAFLAVVGRLGGARRSELYRRIAAVFAPAVSESSDEFYRQVEVGNLDDQMWVIANFAYQNDQPGSAPGGASYGQIARAEGLEPSRPYYERWLRQSASAWGFLWSASPETGKRAHLPAEVLEVASAQAPTAALPAGEALQAGSP